MTTATKTVAAPDAFEIVGEFTYEADYSVQGESQGPRYPWVQADIYQPKNAKEQVRFGLTEDSFLMLATDIPGDIIAASFDDSGDTMPFLVPSNDVRWVILARPRIMGMVKATGDIVPLEKGMRDRGEVTISIVLLACVAAGDFVRDSDGAIQIFTLKLKSSKTAWTGNTRYKDFGQGSNANQRTIEQFNQMLVSYAGGRSSHWLGHTASVRLGAKPEKFTSTASGDSSWGIRFGFEDGSGAAMLPPALAKAAFEFVTTPEFKSLAANPFNKSGTPEPIAAPEPASMAVDDGDMPF
jgi:hypothetical protein